MAFFLTFVPTILLLNRYWTYSATKGDATIGREESSNALASFSRPIKRSWFTSISDLLRKRDTLVNCSTISLQLNFIDRPFPCLFLCSWRVWNTLKWPTSAFWTNVICFIAAIFWFLASKLHQSSNTLTDSGVSMWSHNRSAAIVSRSAVLSDDDDAKRTCKKASGSLLARGFVLGKQPIQMSICFSTNSRWWRFLWLPRLQGLISSQSLNVRTVCWIMSSSLSRWPVKWRTNVSWERIARSMSFR